MKWLPPHTLAFTAALALALGSTSCMAVKEEPAASPPKLRGPNWSVVGYYHQAANYRELAEEHEIEARRLARQGEPEAAAVWSRAEEYRNHAQEAEVKARLLERREVASQ